MARYLRSTTTGVVLPYNEQLLRRVNVEALTVEECAEYEASLNKVPVTAKAKPKAKPKAKAKPAEQPAVLTADISEGEPDAASVLESLGID